MTPELRTAPPLLHDGIAYRIRRSDRARRVRVTLDEDGIVEVVLPRRAAEREARRALVELRPWIERRRAELAATQARVAERGGTVPYLGRTLRLEPQEGRTRVHLDAAHDRLLVPVGDHRPAVERWMRRQAQREIAPRLDAACAQAGLRYTTLSIRNQRTRWASCSTSGAMSFNWRLLLAPPEILEYVVWHEVCHLAVMDHSPRYWALLERHLPEYRDPQRWLRRHGAELVL